MIDKKSRQELKHMAIAKYQAIKAYLQNPVKIAVRSRKMADSASSFLRAVIITGLSFII